MPDYNDYQRILSDLDATVDCSEAHGILCGILSLDPSSNSSEWLGLEEEAPRRQFGRLLANDEETPCSDSIQDAALTRLATLHRDTREQLNDANYHFSPLLPPDDESIQLRTKALSHWCQGFLFGLSISGLRSLDTLSDDCREIVEDVSAIAQLDEQYDSGEDEEAAYMELVEYLRAAVFNLVDEYSTRPDNETLH